jgi:hypothetical protein
MLCTCIAILAVDFRAFPRRFAKAEGYGTGAFQDALLASDHSHCTVWKRRYCLHNFSKIASSWRFTGLMDVGVGSFVVASGLASGGTARAPGLGSRRDVRSITALVMLGKWSAGQSPAMVHHGTARAMMLCLRWTGQGALTPYASSQHADPSPPTLQACFGWSPPGLWVVSTQSASTVSTGTSSSPWPP